MLRRALIDPRRFLRVSVVQNALALYSAQIVSYVLPLLTIPYLTRVLGPDMWGRVAFGQATGLYVLLIVEYGFGYSATRDVARLGEQEETVADLVAGVAGARLVLAAGCALVAALVAALTSVGTRYGEFFWLGVLWGILLAIRPGWYFLGTQRVRLVTACDVAAKLLATLGIFVLVRKPDDAYLALVMQIAAALLSTVITSALLHREVAFRLPTIAAVREALRLGFGFFMLLAAYSLYGSTNVFIVGVVAPGAAVGFFAVAERLYRAVVGLSVPATQAMYPRSSSLVVQDPLRAAKFARVSIVSIFLASLGTAAVLYVAAPLLVPLVFGQAYTASVPMLRVLALVLIPVGVSIPLTSQWMYPLGLESTVAAVAFGAGVLHVALALTLVNLVGAIGAAYALVATESLILAAIWLVLARRNLNPFADLASLIVRVSARNKESNHARVG